MMLDLQINQISTKLHKLIFRKPLIAKQKVYVNSGITLSQNLGWVSRKFAQGECLYCKNN